MEIFVSHAHEDKQIAERLKIQLETTGAKVNLLTYKLDPEKTVIEKIKQGILKCDIGIILWTRNSKDKEWVIQETGALSITNKPLVIFLEPNISPPGGLVSGIHYVKLNDEAALNKLREWLRIKARNKTLTNLAIMGAIGLGLYFLLRSED